MACKHSIHPSLEELQENINFIFMGNFAYTDKTHYNLSIIFLKTAYLKTESAFQQTSPFHFLLF